jgi:response regulator RpfG family c-di-GMP phosphodiesterase
MSAPKKVLVIDDNPESRFLLTKTLLRKFPQVMLLECADAGSATRTAATEELDVVIVHRSADVIGVEMIQMIREVSPTVPIIMVSGIDRSTEALAAGANFFLSYDEWLRIGTVVAELLSLAPTESPVATASPFDFRTKVDRPSSRVAPSSSSRPEPDAEGRN